MKVLLLSKYPRMGASSRLRSLQYIPNLQANGIDVRTSCLFDERYLETIYKKGKKPRLHSIVLYVRRLLSLLASFRYDVIWIEYEVLPYFPAFAERLLKWLGKPYVVDYDDAVFHNYDRSGSPLIRRLFGTKIDVVMRNAACVVAGNGYLADRAQRAGARCVECIPTVVDCERYLSRVGKNYGQPVIGWIGSPSTQRYVVDIRDALKKACDAFGARLLLIGATERVKEQLPSIPVEVAPWSEDSEADLVRQMDVGIMPLKDGPWEKGKCGYKLIQYMACAVPVVASPIGVNKSIVTESQCGYLAGSVDEWLSAMTELLNSMDKREEFGRAGRQAVEAKYSLQVQAPRLASILKSVVAQG